MPFKSASKPPPSSESKSENERITKSYQKGYQKLLVKNDKLC